MSSEFCVYKPILSRPCMPQWHNDRNSVLETLPRRYVVKNDLMDVRSADNFICVLNGPYSSHNASKFLCALPSPWTSPWRRDWSSKWRHVDVVPVCCFDDWEETFFEHLSVTQRGTKLQHNSKAPIWCRNGHKAGHLLFTHEKTLGVKRAKNSSLNF